MVNDSKGVVRYSSVEDIGYINMLLYGPFGSGKTILAASAQNCPETANVLVADAEGGFKSIRDFGYKVDSYRINTFKAFNKLYEFARTHCKLRDIYLTADPNSKEYADARAKLIKLEAWMKEMPEAKITEPKVYQTIIVDSLTEVQKYAMYHILGIDINEVALDQDINIPKIQDWGKNAEMIRMLVRAFRDLDMHTIFTTLDATDKDESDGKIMIAPSLPGKLSKEVPAFVDIVGYMHVVPNKTQPDKPQRMLQVQPMGKYNAKSRYKSLGVYVEDPTITKMIELIKAGEKSIAQAK